MTDRELADRIRAGDREAAAALVRGNYESVLRFLWMLARNSDDAEELAQETFLKALSKIGRFRGESGLRTWLHAIAYHAFVNGRRRLRPATLDGDLATSPFETASALAIDLERALLRLPDQAREAFVLCEVQRLSVREASEILGVPEGTVKSRVHGARVQLRGSLADHGVSRLRAREPKEVDYVQ